MAMPSTSHAAHLLRHAYSYAAIGWHLIPVHGLREDGSCTCGKSHDGSSERSKGKHPILSDWGQQATTHEEVLEEWAERWPTMNLGLVLGPMSQICDIEFDSEQGRATAEKLLGNLLTPTYRSGRSTHWLVRWSKHLPDVQKIVGDLVGGLEVRVGGGGRQTMSVVPPSRHWSGACYEWLPGLSPDEVEVAEFPQALLARIVNGEQEVERPANVLSNGATRARQVLVLEQIPEGERNSSLHAFACREAVRSPDITQPREQADLREKVWAMNCAKCSPPLSEEEVDALVASAIRWLKNTPGLLESRASSTVSVPDTVPMQEIISVPVGPTGKPSRPRINQPVSLGDHGLVPRGGQWTPGDWQLTIVMGDPPTYRLTVPAWADLIGDGVGAVTMSVDEYMDPGKMARAVMLATKSVILEAKPRLWPMLWCGGKDQEGLRYQLMATHTTEAPAVSDLSYYGTAEWLLEQLEHAETFETLSENLTCVQRLYREGSGKPAEWVLSWTKFWRRPIEQGITSAALAKTLAAKMGWKDERYEMRKTDGGARKRVLVLRQHDFDVLSRIVGERD